MPLAESALQNKKTSLSQHPPYTQNNDDLPSHPHQCSRVEVQLIPDVHCTGEEIVLVPELRENAGTSAMFLVLMFPMTGRVTFSDKCYSMSLVTSDM